VIPGLTDHETAPILEAAANAGASHAGRVVLRLPHGVKDVFEAWIDEHYPDRKRKVWSQVRGLRGGELYDTRWRVRQRGTGPVADHMANAFQVWLRRFGLAAKGPELSAAHFRIPGAGAQLDLFGG